MYSREHKSFEQQLDLLSIRGMKVNDREKAIERLKNISYYKIKEFAKPYYKPTEIDGKIEMRYEKISFEGVINRFYKDKNLRIDLLHAIEKVELSFKTRFSYLLGEKDPFNYLKFNFWCNKKEYCKHYIWHKEDEFKNHLKNLIYRNKNDMIMEFLRENPEQKFPPIWMAIDVMSFGDVLNLFELMSIKNREDIAKHFGCTHGELESWLNHLKFIRNKCAHNANVLDLEVRTPPPIKEEWKSIILKNENNESYSNKLATTLVILHYLVKKINESYAFGSIHKTLSNLVKTSDVAANQLGFKKHASINFFFEIK